MTAMIRHFFPAANFFQGAQAAYAKSSLAIEFTDFGAGGFKRHCSDLCLRAHFNREMGQPFELGEVLMVKLRGVIRLA